MSIFSSRHLETDFAGEAVFSGDPIGNSIGFDCILILAILICVIVFAFLLDFIVRCVVRCSGPIHPPGPINLGGATEVHQAIRRLPIVIYGSECSICLNQIEPGERVRLLPNCGHGFHVRCIDRWLVVRSSCPTCRQIPFTCGREGSEWADPEKAVWKILDLQLGR
ncbi:hypothetical protein IEQ34_019241 [Dendrobium chrysotoxum]|uniref:RING-type domain-containing protein n=1 Tax=Dendrobium chrysotoxum TaxID=161865 RepID=A0AAV7G893_DENCH|nr:hypothetical protein IEQ34_019241 [Dendrobium chrysotoxum]